MSPCKQINGVRPSPLKLNKESHHIQKSSNTSSKQPQQQRTAPVIIYTHSPKIIHTKPSDFMALVQKLTGYLHSDEDDEGNGNKQGNNSSNTTITSADGGIQGLDHHHIYTQNSSDYLCSSRNLYRYPDQMYTSPYVGGEISPSFFEVFSGYPDYCN